MKYHIGVKHQQKRPLQLVIIAALVLLAIIGFVSTGVTRWYDRNLQPVNANAQEIVFIVEAGESTRTIADRLESSGLIRHANTFIWYVNRQNPSTIQAGNYRLGGFLSAKAIAAILINGQVDTDIVVIPPGLRLDQIHTILVNSGFDDTSVTEALAKAYDHPLLARFKPAQASLEGYIYPESLQITADSTPESVISRTFDVFLNLLSDPILDGIRQQGLSVHEAIILASIIQEEVSEPETQRTVAQVFLTRLKSGMPLGADPTFRYAAVISGQDASPELDHPYNTRKYAGLPPGPIANFTISALEAVANPSPTDYIYFVSGDDGTTHFSRTFAEHEANIARYCIELCRL